MYAKLNKCEFPLDRISFLRHVVSKDGISANHGKVDVIANWKRLTIVTEIGLLRSSLRLPILDQIDSEMS